MISLAYVATNFFLSILVLSILSISGTTPTGYFRNAVVTAVTKAFSKVREENTLNKELFEAGKNFKNDIGVMAFNPLQHNPEL